MTRSILPLFMALMLTVTFSCPTPVQAGDAVSVTYAVGDWEPYISKRTSHGLTGKLVTAAMEAVGKQAKYAYFPWKRSWLMTTTGDTDGSFPWRMTEKRKQEVYYSDMLIETRGALFFLNPQLSGIRYHDLSHRRDLRVGGVLSYWYLKDFERWGLNADMSMTSKEAFRKLMTGRLDILPEDERTGWMLIRNLFPDMATRFRTVHIPGARTLHAVFPKTPEGRALRDEFNRGLAIIRANGTYDRILRELPE